MNLDVFVVQEPDRIYFPGRNIIGFLLFFAGLLFRKGISSPEFVEIDLVSILPEVQYLTIGDTSSEPI